jgi:hypothetical protein
LPRKSRREAYRTSAARPLDAAPIAAGAAFGSRNFAPATQPYPAPRRAPSAEELFSSTDSDGDGSISQTEFETFLQQMEESMSTPAKFGSQPACDASEASATADALDASAVNGYVQQLLAQYNRVATLA